jgi:general secretion pathway protein L
LKPIAVDVESANGGPAGFDLRAARRQTGDRRSYLIQAGIAAGAILAWLLASYAWGAAREGELESWRQRVAELKPVAERTAGLRRQVEGMAQPFEIARTHAPAQTLSVLAELTTLLPDDAQLTELRMTGPTIELTGLAVNAPALIAKLEASKRFGQVKFRAPVRTVPATGKNRFEISLVLEGGGAR